MFMYMNELHNIKSHMYACYVPKEASGPHHSIDQQFPTASKYIDTSFSIYAKGEYQD